MRNRDVSRYDSLEEIEVTLKDMLIDVETNGSIDYTDNGDFTWLDEFYSMYDYPQVDFISDSEVAYDLLKLLEVHMPDKPGTYKVSGYFYLVYTVYYDAYVYRFLDEDDQVAEDVEDIDEDSLSVKFNRGQSEVSDLSIRRNI